MDMMMGHCVTGTDRTCVYSTYFSWNYFQHCVTLSLPQTISVEMLVLYITLHYRDPNSQAERLCLNTLHYI